MTPKKIRYPSGTIRFTVHGDGKPKAMARMRVKDGKITGGYKLARSEGWEMTVAGQAFRYKPTVPLVCPVQLGCCFYRKIPKYIKNSKKKYERAINLDLLPIPKPDIKNLVANVEDALNEIFWLDDNQVVQYIGVDGIPFGKYYSDIPRIEIVVIPRPDLG